MWPAPDSNPGQGTTTLLVEQVSHHPPITAYVIENKSKGLRLTGHNAQKTSFSGEFCAKVTNLDFALIHALRWFDYCQADWTRYTDIHAAVWGAC